MARLREARRLLVRTASTAQAGVRALLRERGVRYRSLWIANVLALTAPPHLIRVLARRPEVERIAADATVRNVLLGRPAGGLGALGGAGGDPARAAGGARLSDGGDGGDDTPPEEPPSVPSHIPEIAADTAWQRHGVRGEGIVVGVLDTGAKWDHEALKEQYRGWDGTKAEHAGNWHDAIDEANEASPDEPVDADGHGTHVTGLAVGGTDSVHIGVAPEAKWIACRAFFGEEAEVSEIVECLQWFLAPTDENGTPRPELAPHVVNHSWGIFEAREEIKQAVDALDEAGILQVVAAGNFGPFCSSVTFPAMLPNVLAVGSMAENSQDIIAFFSGRGPGIEGSRAPDDPVPDVVAPGEFIWSASNDAGYLQMIGTSQSTPLVTGLAALMWSAEPRLVGDTALTHRLIEQTAWPVVNVEKECDSPKTYPNNVFGWGRVNAAGAVEAALKLFESEPEKPAPPAPPAPPAGPNPEPGPQPKPRLELTGLAADGKCFRATRRRGAGRRNLTLRYRVSADAIVTFTLERMRNSRVPSSCPGERRRPGRRGRRGRPAALDAAAIGVTSGRTADRERGHAMRVRPFGRRSARGRAKAGPNYVRLSQLVAGRRLPAGLYRIQLVARAPGATSARDYLKFWALR